MPIPLIAWGAAGVGVLLFGAGSGAGGYVAARNVSEGLEEGLKLAVPVAAGALAVYAAYRVLK